MAQNVKKYGKGDMRAGKCAADSNNNINVGDIMANMALILSGAGDNLRQYNTK